MAHFHRPPNGQRISGEEITVTASSITIGLWGYLDFNRQELEVVPRSSMVRATPGRVVGNSREWTITTIGCDRVRVEARTPGGHLWDWIELTFTSREAIITRQRLAAIAEAQRHVGAHYVWGAAGAKPGGQEGMSRRRGSVAVVANRLDPRSPCLNAAACSVDGLHVCAGRHRALSGRVLQVNDPSLVRYLEGLQGTPPEQWQPFEGLWPRMMEGYTVPRQIVLGESCLGVRHFDCVGFVNYCMEVAVGRPIQDSITGWIERAPEVTGTSDLPGDILTKGVGHIGMSMGNGNVIHASETARGVVIDRLTLSEWRRGRFLR